MQLTFNPENDDMHASSQAMPSCRFSSQHKQALCSAAVVTDSHTDPRVVSTAQHVPAHDSTTSHMMSPSGIHSMQHGRLELLTDDRGLLQVLDVPAVACKGQWQHFFPHQQQHKQAQNLPSVQCNSPNLSQGQDVDDDLASPGCSVAIIMPNVSGVVQTVPSTFKCLPDAGKGAAATLVTEGAPACRSHSNEGSMQAMAQAADSTATAPAALARGFGSFFLVTPPEAAGPSTCTGHDPDDDEGQSRFPVSQQTCSLHHTLDDSMVEDFEAAKKPKQQLQQVHHHHHHQEQQFWDQQLQGSYQPGPNTASPTEPINGCQGMPLGALDTLMGDLLDTVLDHADTQNDSSPSGEGTFTTAPLPTRAAFTTTTGRKKGAGTTTAAEKEIDCSAVTAAGAVQQEMETHRMQCRPHAREIFQELPAACPASQGGSLSAVCLPSPGLPKCASPGLQADDLAGAAVVQVVQVASVQGAEIWQGEQKPASAVAAATAMATAAAAAAAAVFGCASSNPNRYLLCRPPLDLDRELLGDVSGNVDFADVFSDDSMDPDDPATAANRFVTEEGTAPQLQVGATEVSARSCILPQENQQQKDTQQPQPGMAAVLPVQSFPRQRSGPVIMPQSWMPMLPLLPPLPPQQQQQVIAAPVRLGLSPRTRVVRPTITTGAVTGQRSSVQQSSCSSPLTTISWNIQQQQQQQHAGITTTVPQVSPELEKNLPCGLRSGCDNRVTQIHRKEIRPPGQFPQVTVTAPAPAVAHSSIQATSYQVPCPAPGADFAPSRHIGIQEQHNHTGWQSPQPHSRNHHLHGQQQPAAGWQALQSKAAYDQLHEQRTQHALHQPVHRSQQHQHNLAGWASPSAKDVAHSAQQLCAGVVHDLMQHYQLRLQQPQAFLQATQQQQQHPGAVAGLDRNRHVQTSASALNWEVCAAPSLAVSTPADITHAYQGNDLLRCEANSGQAVASRQHTHTCPKGLQRSPPAILQSSSLQADTACGFADSFGHTASMQLAGRTVTSQQVTQSGVLVTASASDTAAAAAVAAAAASTAAATMHKLPAKTGTGRPRGRPRKHPLPVPAADVPAVAARPSPSPVVDSWQLLLQQQQQQCFQASQTQQHVYQHCNVQHQSASPLCALHTSSAIGPPNELTGGLAMNRKRCSSFSGLEEPQHGFKLPRSSFESSPAAQQALSMGYNSHSNRTQAPLIKLQKKTKAMHKPVTQDGIVIPPPAGPEMAARGWPPFSDLVVGGFFPPGTYDFSCGTVPSVVATVTPTGLIQWNNETFQSISSFALAVVRTVKTTRQACDGWRECRLKGIKIHEWRAAFWEKRAPPLVPPEAIIIQR